MNTKPMTNEELQRQVLLQQVGPKTNHLVHLVLTLLTGGLWLVVWLFTGQGNVRKQLDARAMAETGRATLMTRITTRITQVLLYGLAAVVGFALLFSVYAVNFL